MEVFERNSTSTSATSAEAPSRSPLPLCNILAYVHMRNIHGSTGAGRTARQITEHLALRSDVSLRILADANDRQRIVPLVQQPWSSYRYHTFSSDTSKQQARWFLLNSPKAETFWPQADIVFCTAESYVPATRARLVVTAHDAGYFEHGAHTRDPAYWKTRLKWELLFRKLSRKVGLFHTVSNFSAERLAHFFPAIRSRIRAVHNGVTPHFFKPVPPAGLAYVAEAGLASRPFVLVPGGLHFRKNAELILEAVPLLQQRFPDLIVAIVNHSNLAYVARAQALGPNVRLLGFVSDDALHALYSTATVVWYPSRYEGFGLPVVEAMACGACVVASNSSSIPEIAGDAALLADPADPHAHVDAITALLSDDRARANLACAGKLRAASFTWTACADQLRHHFDTLLR
jgi:glycosyltransferase involved in cell wall biosynthesis